MPGIRNSGGSPMYALWSDGAYDVQTIVTALFVIAIVFMVFRKFFR